MNKSKKIISIVAAGMLAMSTFGLAACGSKDYKGETLTDGYDSNASVASNGGFVVEKGEYVYFINGKEVNTADNTYGDVVKGALMRISKTDLAAGKDGAAAQIVVPSLFVTGNYDSGIYIYGDYVYYATPTTDRNNDGEVANTSLDFKRAKIDGSEAPMGGKDDYFFRLTSNSVKYRYVQEGEVVYCLYEQDGKLQSYNTQTGETTVLVAGASTFYYDTEDLASGDVYYTMNVSYDIDQTNTGTEKYNQIFCVNAAAKAKTYPSEARYEAYEGETKVAEYDFDADALKAKAEQATSTDSNSYQADDYTTYPYVNLGKLVLDGIGSSQDFPKHQMMNVDEASKAAAAELSGYTYTLQSQTNGGLYFTRKATTATENDPAYLYYIPNARENWNTITSNAAPATTLIAKDTTKASATALYQYDKTANEHSYFYISGTNLKKVTGDTEMTLMEELASESTLWKVEGDYLYYYGTGTNGKSLSRIDITGSADDYKEIYSSDKFKSETVALVDFNDSWYKPEFVKAGNKTLVLFANAQSYGVGGSSYDYIYAADVTNVAARNEAIQAITDKIDEYEDNSEAQAVMQYYFQTGSLEAYEAEDVKKLYDEKTQQKYISDFVAEFKPNKADGLELRDFYLPQIGRMNEDDAEAIQEAWVNSLKQETTTDEEDDGLETWAIVLIVCGGVIVVAAAVLVPLLIVMKKKEAEKKREEAIVSAYKHKRIDTTDDKSIDVYADDELSVEESTEQAPVEEEAPVEELVEEGNSDEKPSQDENADA